MGEDAKSRLRVRQLDQILSHSAIAALLATVFAAVIAAFFAPTFGAALAKAWFIAKAASAAPRLLVAIGYKQDRVREILRRKPWVLHSTTVLDGTIWGLAGLASAMAPVDAASALVACLAVVATVATLGLQVQLLATACFVTPVITLTMVGLLLRFDGLGLFASIGLGLLIVQLWVSAFATEKRLAKEFLSSEQLSQALKLQSETAERLAKASEQLRREGAVKSMFLGTMSHELRTPLHGILGITALMKRGRQDPETLARIGIVQAQGEHLLGLIGALLDVSRIETGRLELHTAPFDLAHEVRQLADLYRERMAATTAVTFTVDTRLPATCWVSGDAARVRQVLHNLLGNAVKFTKQGWIKLSVTRGEHGETVCIVSDTGPGISPADQVRIFEAFAQSASVATQPDVGTGLGLAISRELANAMGGQVTAESIVGVGSKFQFKAVLPAVDAPVHEEDSHARAANGASSHSFSGYRILLAEDNDVNALIAEAVLRQLGAEVSRVSSGRDAVAAATASQRPHAILMDLRMPDLDGLAATREIRASEDAARISRVPIIALTANSSRDDVAACAAAGMNGFLSKPFTDEELAWVLASHLGPGIPLLADENEDLRGGHQTQAWSGRSGAVH